MSDLEKAEEKRIKTWCEDNGVLFIKYTPFGSRGWPDRIVIFPGGFHLWVELKRRGKFPKKLQYHRLIELSNQGAQATWFDNSADCIEYFQDCLDAALEVKYGVDTPPLSVTRNKYSH